VKPPSLLRPIQHRIIDELKCSTGLQLVVGMGGGKTISTLTAIVDLLAARIVRAAIIIAPARVAPTTWPNEIAGWEHTKHLDAVVLAGSPEKRLRRLREQHEVYICSIDNLVWLIDALRDFKSADPRWDMLVIDELSRFKSPRGERAKKLNRFTSRFKAIIGLTGTPRPNSWEDIYMPLQIVSAGEAWDTHGFDDWRRKHFVQMDYHGYRWQVRDDAIPYLRRVIDTWTLTIPPDQATNIPFNSGLDFDVVVPLSKAQETDLASLEKELIVELGGEGVNLLDASEEIVQALSQATATHKMSQILQGFLYRDGDTVQTYGVAKLNALDDLLAAADGENVIIVYEYRHDLELLKKHLPTARYVDREQSDEDFVQLIKDCRAGQVQYLLAHPANLGHGVDGLQHGFARMIWYQYSWSPELVQQLTARIARSGQMRPVYSHRIVADHWLERRRIERVERKMVEEAEFISTLRRIE
jgi:SNF2 family DNA or RNA helicase